MTLALFLGSRGKTVTAAEELQPNNKGAAMPPKERIR